MLKRACLAFFPLSLLMVTSFGGSVGKAESDISSQFSQQQSSKASTLEKCRSYWKKSQYTAFDTRYFVQSNKVYVLYRPAYDRPSDCIIEGEYVLGRNTEESDLIKVFKLEGSDLVTYRKYKKDGRITRFVHKKK